MMFLQRGLFGKSLFLLERGRAELRAAKGHQDRAAAFMAKARKAFQEEWQHLKSEEQDAARPSLPDEYQNLIGTVDD